jgi:hypothetical protein
MASGPTIMAAIGMDATNFNAAVSRVTERTNAMAAQMSKAGFSKAGVDAAVAAEKFSGMRGELVKMGMSPAAAAAAMRAQDASAQKAANSTSALGSAMKGMAAFMTVDFLQAQVQQIIAYGGEVSDLSARMGISTTAVQQWDFALKQNGSSIDAAVPFFERLAQARDKALGGDEKSTKSFERFGIGLDQLRKSKQDNDLAGVAGQIADTYKKGANPQQFMGDLRNIGGRAAGELVAAFQGGLQELFANAPVIDKPFISQLDAVGDKMDELRQRFMGIFAPVVAVAGTVATTMAEGFLQKMDVVKSTVGGFFGGIVSGFKEGGLFGVNEGARKGLAEGFMGAVKRAHGGKAKTEGDKIKQAEAAQEEEALSAQQERLQKTLQDKLEANEFAKFETDEQKRSALLKKRAQLEREVVESKAAGKTTDSLKSQIELAGVDKEISSLDQKERAELAKLSRHSVNSLQSGMGGFLGNFRAAAGPETSAANAAVKSEQHLAHLVRAAEQLRAVMSGKNPNTGEDF